MTELEPGVRARGSYLVKPDDWYLAGHFPGNPIMPGVLQVEALAQLGSVCGLAHPDFAGKLALFAGIDDVRFKRIVRPGDVLDLECAINRLRGPDRKGRCDRDASAASWPAGRRSPSRSPPSRRRRDHGLQAGRRGARASASFAPERVVTNDELATRVETSDEWIASRTGIRERRIASDERVGGGAGLRGRPAGARHGRAWIRPTSA